MPMVLSAFPSAEELWRRYVEHRAHESELG